MPLTLFLFAVALGAWALVWVRVLSADGHLLAGLQRYWRGWYRVRYDAELDEAWWWRPLWGCPGCHAGQLALYLYPLRYHATYDPLLHVLTLGVAITTACLLTFKWNNAN